MHCVDHLVAVRVDQHHVDRPAAIGRGGVARVVGTGDAHPHRQGARGVDRDDHPHHAGADRQQTAVDLERVGALTGVVRAGRGDLHGWRIGPNRGHGLGGGAVGLEFQRRAAAEGAEIEADRRDHDRMVLHHRRGGQQIQRGVECLAGVDEAVAEIAVPSGRAQIVGELATGQQGIDLRRGQARVDVPHQRQHTRDMRGGQRGAFHRTKARLALARAGKGADRAVDRVHPAGCIDRAGGRVAARGHQGQCAAAVGVVGQLLVDIDRPDRDHAAAVGRGSDGDTPSLIVAAGIACGGHHQHAGSAHLIDSVLIGHRAAHVAAQAEVDHIGPARRHHARIVGQPGGVEHRVGDVERRGAVTRLENAQRHDLRHRRDAGAEAAVEGTGCDQAGDVGAVEHRAIRPRGRVVAVGAVGIARVDVSQEGAAGRGELAVQLGVIQHHPVIDHRHDGGFRAGHIQATQSIQGRAQVDLIVVPALQRVGRVVGWEGAAQRLQIHAPVRVHAQIAPADLQLFGVLQGHDPSRHRFGGREAACRGGNALRRDATRQLIQPLSHGCAALWQLEQLWPGARPRRSLYPSLSGRGR